MTEDDYCQSCADESQKEWVHQNPADSIRGHRQDPDRDPRCVEDTYDIEYSCRGCETHPEPAMRGTCYMKFAASKWCPLCREDEGLPIWEWEIL
jgi:hypothetical protein